MPNRSLFVGLMSGTSLDGIDCALVDFADGRPRVIAADCRPFTSEFRIELLALQRPGIEELHRAALAANTLAEAYARATLDLLTEAQIPPLAVAAIGMHGQTIRHRPEHGYTLQIGNAALLAELTGISVVSDFRSRDVAAGGQGAPLVPAFHQAVFSREDRHRVIVNVGGIANLTDLPGSGGVVTGFDTGPGNVLMDGWIQRHLGRDYDAHGAWAASGRLNPALLDRLLSEPFFAEPPPKSTGRDLFQLDWLDRHLAQLPPLPPVDVQATLLALTSLTIAHAIERITPNAREVYVCGGGAHNTALIAALAYQLPSRRVSTTAMLDLDPDWVEAVAFAWLARQRLLKQPGNLAEVTGAAGARILGAVHIA
ncbi:anhydro-N-acetylmuramic acid kinase [Chitinimonas lacunae]|uniref:Anhydro-N-acetylmuramic acid kinase n=1 Tax=Chitinimonas lacunae TaxID=1963018 RepID=A0ABV8MJW7_9NEIS